MKIILFVLIAALCIIGINALVGGSSVSQQNSRFVASVRLRSFEKHRFGSGYICTATVISTWNILTSASCVNQVPVNDLSVVMGNNNRNSETLRTVITNVQRVFIHPNFTRYNSLANNLAVLRLERNIRNGRRLILGRSWNSHIQPISLEIRVPALSQNCRFFGWELNRLNLLTAILPVQNQTCIRNTRNSSNDTFCAGNLPNCAPTFCSALCYGNRGGPLICNDGLIAGIAIDDTGCARENTTGYFQAISVHRQWILQVSSSKVPLKSSICLTFVLLFLIFVMRFEIN